MRTDTNYGARALDMSFRGHAAAYSATVRLTSSEAAWLARREREDVDEATLRECMSGADTSSLVVDPTVTATNGMSVSAALPSEEEERQVRQAEQRVPVTYRHVTGMVDDGTVWGWTNLADRFGVERRAKNAARGGRPVEVDTPEAQAHREAQARYARKQRQAARDQEREQENLPTLDFDAVMAAMATSAASGTGLGKHE